MHASAHTPFPLFVQKKDAFPQKNPCQAKFGFTPHVLGLFAGKTECPGATIQPTEHDLP
jgi:hypothetical protein